MDVVTLPCIHKTYDENIKCQNLNLLRKNVLTFQPKLLTFPTSCYGCYRLTLLVYSPVKVQRENLIIFISTCDYA